MAETVLSPDTAPKSSRIAKEDKIPFGQKLAFAMGMNTEYIATGLMTGVLWMPFFNIGMGIEPWKLGIVLMILRAWDAISDPIIGYVSDNARTRWGRRRPFMVLGAVLSAAIYPAFWHMPESFTEMQKLTYLGAIGILFFTSFTTWAMPYYGLQLELTPNYDERTRLSAWMALFSKLSALIGNWIPALATSALFINQATGEGDLVIGMKTVGWLIAGMILVVGLLPPLFVKERYYDTEAKTQPKQSLIKAVKDSAGNKPLWSLIGISFFLVLGTMSIATLNQYLVIYYLFEGDQNAGFTLFAWRMSVVVVTGIITLPIATWLSERFDKKAMVIGTLFLGILGVESNYIFMRPDMPYLQLIAGVLEASAYSAMWLFLPSMKADIADDDELKTSRRREGSINAFYSWFIKLSLTCAMGVGGTVLSLSGFDAKLGGAQPEHVIDRMFGLYLMLPVAIWGCAILVAFFYPLNRARMGEIRDELEARRGKI